MKLFVSARRLAAVIAIILSFIVLTLIAARWVDYQEAGCTHFGGYSYEERGTGFFFRDGTGFPQIFKLSIESRVEKPLKIEDDFDALRLNKETPGVTKLDTISRCFPAVFQTKMDATHCNNFNSSLYETNGEFRAAVKACVVDGSIPIEDLVSAISNCNLPVENLTPGVLKVLALFRQYRLPKDHVGG